MVERIKIIPSQIVTRDAGGNITFNSDYSYLKTGGGSLYAGGYSRAPAIYGQGTVTDHTAPPEGWFTQGFYSGTGFNGEVSNSYDYYVPKADQVYWRTMPDYGALLQPLFISPYERNVSYYNYDTYSWSNMSITYRWAIGQWGFGTDGADGYASVEWQIYPIFSSYGYFPYIANPSGGIYRLDYLANEYGDYFRNVSTADYYGNTYNIVQYGRNYYTRRTVDTTDYYGNPTTYTYQPESIRWRKNGFFTRRDSVALSLGVTA